MAGDTSTFELRWPWSAAATFVGLMWIAYAWSIWAGGGIDAGSQGMMMGSLSGMGYYVTGAIDTRAIVRDREWERLVSGIFLHGGFLHIIMNSAAILQLGRVLEMFTTRGRCWLTLLVSGLCGSVATVVWAELTGTPQMSIGASGAGCGLGAALIVLSRGVAGLGEFRRQMITWVAVMLAFGLIPMISGTGHLGGALGGALAGLALRKRGSMRMANDRYSGGLDLATKVLTLVFFAALAVNVWRTNERKADFAVLDEAANAVYGWLEDGKLPDLGPWRANLEGLELPSLMDREREGLLALVDQVEKLEPGALGANAEAIREAMEMIRGR
jgi:membrane associated rhomboid family serine protease